MTRPEFDPDAVAARDDEVPRGGGADEIADRLAEAIQVSAEPQSVPVNMYEADGAIVVVAALPGVMAEDIEITIDSRWVRIWADCRSLAPKDYLRHEWHYGPYQRMVDLPPGFEGEPSASYGNGQLAVRIGRGGRRSAPVVVQPAG